MHRLIAASDPGFQAGLNWVRGGTLLLALTFAGLGCVLLFSKSPPGKPETSVARLARWFIGVALIGSGIFLPFYMWN